MTKDRIPCAAWGCAARATVREIVSLFAFGRGRGPSGSAVYYSCDEHARRQVGERTDMSETVKVERMG